MFFSIANYAFIFISSSFSPYVSFSLSLITFLYLYLSLTNTLLLFLSFSLSLSFFLFLSLLISASLSFLSDLSASLKGLLSYPFALKKDNRHLDYLFWWRKKKSRKSFESQVFLSRSLSLRHTHTHAHTLTTHTHSLSLSLSQTERLTTHTHFALKALKSSSDISHDRPRGNFQKYWSSREHPLPLLVFFKEINATFHLLSLSSILSPVATSRLYIRLARCDAFLLTKQTKYRRTSLYAVFLSVNSRICDS